MKKLCALLLIALLAFGMTGCAENLKQVEIPPLPEVTPTPAPTMRAEAETPEEPDAPEEEETQEPEEHSGMEENPSQILVTNGNTTLYNYDPAEGTERILTFSYDMPRVYAEDYPEACSRINETLATVEELFYTGNSYGEEGNYSGYSAMLEIAEDNFTYAYNTEEGGLPLELSDALSARVTRADNRVLSLLYSEVIYTGGAHSSYLVYGYTFDMSTGEMLTLDRLSSDYDALAESLLRSMMALVEQDEDGYYTDRLSEEIFPDGSLEEALRALLREDSWYFDRDGMVIFSSLYELDPDADGIVEFHIPYAQLRDKVDAKWLRPGLLQEQGSLGVCPLSELEGGETEIVDKLTVQEGGEALCLVAEGRIYDVSISTAYYDDSFHENRQLWYASTMSDCALQLETVVPEGLPELMMSYTTADGQRQIKLLSQSGLDGAYTLVDDSIEAVG